MIFLNNRLNLNLPMLFFYNAEAKKVKERVTSEFDNSIAFRKEKFQKKEAILKGVKIDQYGLKKDYYMFNSHF